MPGGVTYYDYVMVDGDLIATGMPADDIINTLKNRTDPGSDDDVMTNLHQLHYYTKLLILIQFSDFKNWCAIISVFSTMIELQKWLTKITFFVFVHTFF